MTRGKDFSSEMEELAKQVERWTRELTDVMLGPATLEQTETSGRRNLQKTSSRRQFVKRELENANIAMPKDTLFASAPNSGKKLINLEK